MTKEAFENAIYVASAIGASSNCPPHLTDSKTYGY